MEKKVRRNLINKLTICCAAESGALVATIDLDRAAKHRAGMGFFRDRRPQLYGRICEDI